MIHQAGSGPSRDQLFHLSTTARDIPYRIVNGVARSRPTTCSSRARPADDVRAVIDAAGEGFRLMLIFAASTGARAGEQWASR